MTNKPFLGLALVALAACQSAPEMGPLNLDEAFANVRFEFNT